MTLLEHSKPCKFCGSSDAYAYWDDGERCFSCDHTVWYDSKKKVDEKFDSKKVTLPKDFTLDLPLSEIEWIEQYYIDEVLRRKYNIGYSPNEVYGRVIIPNYRNKELVSYSARAVYQSKNKYISKGPKLPFCSQRKEGNLVVLVEDPLSAIRVGELFPAIGLLGNTASKKRLTKVLTPYTKFLVWLDPDRGGYKGLTSLLPKLSIYGKWKIIRSEKDPKYYTDREILEYVKRSSDSWELD